MVDKVLNWLSKTDGILQRASLATHAITAIDDYFDDDCGILKQYSGCRYASLLGRQVISIYTGEIWPGRPECSQLLLFLEGDDMKCKYMSTWKVNQINAKCLYANIIGRYTLFKFLSDVG